ncbi:hypothetical protein FRC05_009543 [Tulasnella sp. 425]|nr:hypothetical protein FRC05_009543 [Tulasnella sp. 425]
MTCNVLLVGYGAVGIVIAYALQKTGKVNVTAVARNDRGLDTRNRFLGNFYRGEDGSLATTSSQEESFHRLVDLLNQGGCEVKADPHPQAAKFRKNLCDELASQGATSTLHTIVTELITIGKASGHPSEYLTDPKQLIEYGRKYHEGTKDYKPSTLLDVEAGRPFELEVILGEVVRQGKRFNLPIPTLEMMYNTLNIVQRQFVLAAAKKVIQ